MDYGEVKGGEGCVKWSGEKQRSNTHSPQASGPGTIGSIHTHTHVQSCARMQTHLAPLMPTVPWATWPTSLPW